MHQLKILSIFLVWIWANISLQKSIPECLHSSSGLEACTSKCFWNDGSREKALCKWDLGILGDPSLVFPPDFISTPPPSPPLPSLLWIEAFEDHRHVKEPFLSVTEFTSLLTALHTHSHRKMQTNNARLVFRNLTVGCSVLLCISQHSLQLLPTFLIKKKKKNW